MRPDMSLLRCPAPGCGKPLMEADLVAPVGALVRCVDSHLSRVPRERDPDGPGRYDGQHGAP